MSNVQLGAEQGPVDVGTDTQEVLLGGGQLVIPLERFQCDVANPRHQFKISAVEIIIEDGLVATLLEVGVFGVDQDTPVNDLQKFYGRSVPVLPIAETTMKIPLDMATVINGDTFVTPYWVANGNVRTHQGPTIALTNTSIVTPINSPWEIEDDKPWIARTFQGFFRIYFRRLVDVP